MSIPTASERRIRAALLAEAARLRGEGAAVTVAELARRTGLGYRRTWALVDSMRRAGEWRDATAVRGKEA